MPFTVWDFFPAAFNCPHTILRLGRLGDGGKWLCGLERHVGLPHEVMSHNQPTKDPSLARISTLTSGKGPVPGKQPGCIIYSFGIFNESSFESEMIGRTPHCQIWGYDFSVNKFGADLDRPEAKGRTHFTQVGIAGKSDTAKDPPFISIQDLMAINGHDHIDILKMDIEGFEFEAMRSFIEYYQSRDEEVPLSQFLVEIHLDETTSWDMVVAWWELLESAGFRPVWTEPNLLVVT